MKILILTLFAAILVVPPLYMLDQLVLPELTQLQYTYSHADETASRLVSSVTSE